MWLRVAGVLQEKLPHRVKAIVPREQRIVVANLGGGVSELRGKSADRPAGLLGEAIDFVVVDEATKLRDDIWPNYLMLRLIDRRGWSLIISTPEGPGWFYEEFMRGQCKRDPDYESWAMPSWTNPHVGRDVIEAEQSRLTEEEFKAQFNAECIGVPKRPCELCGGPSKEVSGEITLRVGQKLVRCSGCNMPIDPDSRCIVRKMNGNLSMLDVDYRSDTDPEPEYGTLLKYSTPSARSDFLTSNRSKFIWKPRWT